MVLLALVVYLAQAETQPWQPEVDVLLFRAVDVEGTFLCDEGEALPVVEFGVALLAEGVGCLSEEDASDVLDAVCVDRRGTRG